MMNEHPQAAPEQDRKTYRYVTAQLGLIGLDPAIPEGVRDLAVRTVAHTREACDASTDAFDASVAAFERSFVAAGKGAAAFNRKVIDIARRDENSSFDLATSLAGAKSLYDVVKSRAAIWREQVDALTVQAKSVRALYHRGNRCRCDERSDGEKQRATPSKAKAVAKALDTAVESS